jgi:hypothetical protein
MKSIDWPTPFGYTLFCDDIRQEIGGKVTLVGLYSSDLIVFSDLPVTLPKIALSVSYFEVRGESEESLELRVYLPGDSDDTPTLRSTIADELLDKLRKLDIPADVLAENPRVGLNLHIGFSPITLTQEGWIRVRMIRGQDEIRIGSLRIRSYPPTRNPTGAADDLTEGGGVRGTTMR